jgi:hypothetical protein
MNAFMSNPWNIVIVLVLPAIVIGLAKSLKRFNEKIAEKGCVKKEVES